MTELRRTAWGMAEAAERNVERISIEDVREVYDDEDVTLLDIRDVRELWIEGTIPGAKHAPRGMLEFWADPETKYYRDYFDPRRRYVLFCNEAGRSALAAERLREMGFEDVAHLDGGFTAWREAGYPVEEVEQRDYKNRSDG
ncbi:rhodanese-like domain-containing protein [Halomarina halobia]|uniref:Rhodanese-like domain-containing protein n=1 Tax=Halomarina halobia TaxID=3033386 RepID=A0ABD6A4N5_9EURY|nr:rhodanese-like domain-containing protein [Halomarina sp. PSR21]